MMTAVRTTLTLDDDVFCLVEEAIHRERCTMKHVINDALRSALAQQMARQQLY
nr:hypothetical protein [Mycobacterium uberis]